MINIFTVQKYTQRKVLYYDFEACNYDFKASSIIGFTTQKKMIALSKIKYNST